jgi:sulfiredoxin
MSGKSVHSANIAEIHEMPMSEIIRPIPSELDHKKVDSIVETLKVKNHEKIQESNLSLFEN